MSGPGQQEADGDEPDEAGKAGERDEKEKLGVDDEVQPTELASRGEDEAEDDEPFRKDLHEGRGDGDARHEQPHGDGKAGPAQSVAEIVERDHNIGMRGDGGMDHRPRGHGAGHGVEDDQEAAEERDVDAGSARAEEVQAADDGGDADAEADKGAELQEHTEENARALGLEEWHDGGCGLPWTG